MEESIFKEVLLTPHIFEKNFLKDRIFERLLNILDNLAESGQIVAISPEWFKYVSENISFFDDMDKYDIQHSLNYLDKRNRIVFSSDKKLGYIEGIWLDLYKKLREIRDFDMLISSQEIKELKRELVNRSKNKGATVLPQSKENMQKILSPILSYAQIVKVFDPYFDLSKPRYSDAFRIICKALGFKHGQKSPQMIEIHTSVKVLLDKNGTINPKIFNQYQNILQKFEDKYSHTIKLYIWEEDGYKWHDRWIITNQCAVILGKGSDVSEWTDATWGLLNYEDASKIESLFNTNRSKFHLVSELDKNTLKKYGSKEHREGISEQDRQEKLKNVKSFKKS